MSALLPSRILMQRGESATATCLSPAGSSRIDKNSLISPSKNSNSKDNNNLSLKFALDRKKSPMFNKERRPSGLQLPMAKMAPRLNFLAPFAPFGLDRSITSPADYQTSDRTPYLASEKPFGFSAELGQNVPLCPKELEEKKIAPLDREVTSSTRASTNSSNSQQIPSSRATSHLDHSLSCRSFTDASLLPEPFPEEHELAKTWCVWEQMEGEREPHDGCDSDGEDSQDAYKAAHKSIKCFNTIESFFLLHNGIPPPSAIINKSHLVRNKSMRDLAPPELLHDHSCRSQMSCRSILGNFPMDEDDHANAETIESVMYFEDGVFPFWEDPAHDNGGLIQFTFKTDFPSVAIDELWERLVFTVLGNVLPHADKITGVRMADRLPPIVPAHGGPIVAVRFEVWHRELPKDALRELTKQCITLLKEHLTCGGNAVPGRTIRKPGRAGRTFQSKTSISYSLGGKIVSANNSLTMARGLSQFSMGSTHNASKRQLTLNKLTSQKSLPGQSMSMSNARRGSV
jgi:hypothetical protein